MSSLPDWLETTPFTDWGIYGEGRRPVPGHGEKGLYGSYGINDWVHNPPPGNPNGDGNYWRTMINVKTPSTVPVFGDSVWEGTAARDTDQPSGTPGKSPNLSGMWNFCIPRHGLAVNWVFFDLTARKVPIKELWNQKWSPNFITYQRIAEWPNWMNDDWGN